MDKEEAIKYLQQIYPNGGHCWLDEQRIEAIGMAVKALQEEPVSDDLEKEIKNYFEDWYDGGAAEYGCQATKPNCYFATVEDCKDIARHFANWQRKKELRDMFMSDNRHFKKCYEQGKADAKQEMMKGLCFETKVYLEDDGCAEDFNYMEWLALENTEITELPVEALGLKDGDKVKIIMVKED